MAGRRQGIGHARRPVARQAPHARDGRVGPGATRRRTYGPLVLVLGVLALGCPFRLPPRFPALAECPGPLVPTGEIPGAFLLRQDVRVRAAEVDAGVRLIVQKKGGRLVLVGFTTLGLEAFTLVQEDTTTTVDSALGPAWPVPPVNLLRDLHRSRFLALPGAPLADGEHRATRGGVAIGETWRDGTLVARTFTGPGETPADAVRVTFAGATATIVHPRCGYEATIVTTEERPL